MELSNRLSVVSLWLLSLLAVKVGGTCDVDGQWYDAASSRNHQVSLALLLKVELVIPVTF